MLVVEIAEGIEQRLLTIGALHHSQEPEKRIAELTVRQSASGLNINHRYQVLLARQTLCLEILKLLHQGCPRTEEVIRSHLQPVTMRQFDVTLITLVDTVATLRSLQIDIGHLGVLANGLPEHLPLVVRQVDAVHMTTGVLTHD